MESLLEQGLRRRRWGTTLWGLGTLRWLLRTADTPTAWPCISTLETSHVVLLHLEVVLVLEPLLESGSGLLLGHRPRVALTLRAWWPPGLLSGGTLSHSASLHPGLSHESLTLRRLRLLELTVIYHLLLLGLLLLLLLLLLLEMSSH